ncbi:MAG: hypothetical protein V4524_04215 [Patescibacteria group bacterium]
MNSQNIEGSRALLSSSWLFFKSHWQVLVSIVVIPNVLNYVASLFLQTGTPVTVFFGAFISIGAMILSVAMAAAVVRSVQTLSSDSTQALSVKTQYKIGFGYFWSLVFLALISGLATMGGFMLLVVPGIIVSVYGSMYAYALIIDGKKGFSALTESYSLVYGRWSAVFGRLFILAAVAVIIQIVFSGIYFLIALLFGVNIYSIAAAHAQLPVLITLVGFVFNLAVQAVVGPIAIIYTYRLYLSLKATRQAEVSAGTFKRWLVALMIIGPILFILSIVALVTIVGLSAMKHAQQLAQQQAQLQQSITQIKSLTPTR